MSSKSSMFSKYLILCYITSSLSNELNYNIHIFYYPWYGSPPNSKLWVHWNGEMPGVLDHKPADGDIASNYFPVIGAYDSCNPKVLEKHMQWITEAGVGTIISSWRGNTSFENRCVNMILDSAKQRQIKVGFHLEPYEGRSAESVINDIQYISEKYGNHSSYFRDPMFNNRDVFYVYNIMKIKDWSPIEPLKKYHIILAQTTDQSTKHFSGFYNYRIEDNNNIIEIWKNMNDFCKSNDYIWSPSIGPGYIDKRAKPKSVKTNINRKSGQTYDNNWEYVFNSSTPKWVSITSFNEWPEGTMIEPVSYNPPKGFSYLTFNDSYNTTGMASEKIYLERTAFWVKEFTKRSKQ